MNSKVTDNSLTRDIKNCETIISSYIKKIHLRFDEKKIYIYVFKVLLPGISFTQNDGYKSVTSKNGISAIVIFFKITSSRGLKFMNIKSK